MFRAYKSFKIFFFSFSCYTHKYSTYIIVCSTYLCAIIIVLYKPNTEYRALKVCCLLLNFLFYFKAQHKIPRHTYSNNGVNEYYSVCWTDPIETNSVYTSIHIGQSRTIVISYPIKEHWVLTKACWLLNVCFQPTRMSVFMKKNLFCVDGLMKSSVNLRVFTQPICHFEPSRSSNRD